MKSYEYTLRPGECVWNVYDNRYIPCYNVVRSHKTTTAFHNFCIWLFGGPKYQGGDGVEARGIDEQPLSDNPPLRQCGESYKFTTSSSNLKAQHKILLKRGGGVNFSVDKDKWF